MDSSQELKGSVSIADWNGSVVCPRPRRVGPLVNHAMFPSIWHSHQADIIDSDVGAELLDIILMKEKCSTQLASSPPFFSGSPPSRSANPLIEDSRFVDEKIISSSPSPIQSPSGLSSPCSAHKGGCIRVKFGHKPAEMRVEGFDCLNRGCQHSGVTAVAF